MVLVRIVGVVVLVRVRIGRDRGGDGGAEIEIVIRQKDERGGDELVEEGKERVDRGEDENFASDLEAYEEDLQWSEQRLRGLKGVLVRGQVDASHASNNGMWMRRNERCALQ